MPNSPFLILEHCFVATVPQNINRTSCKLCNHSIHGGDRLPKNVTISISDDLAEKMDAMPEINWSEVCRQCISKYIEEREPEEKGELLKGLEEYLKTHKLPKPEEKESVRKAEVERFTKKWGKPDYVTNTEEEPYYVTIQKKQEVKHGDQVIAELDISNSRVLASGVHERVEKGFGKYDINLYDKNLEPLVEYFKSKGFTIAEENLLQTGVMHYVLKTFGSQSREQWRELANKGYHYFGLFAADKEDYVFIAYREVKTSK